MLKSISVSDLREQIKRVLNEVSYGQIEYLVEKSGEPTAAIISIDDFHLLQEVKAHRQESAVELDNSFSMKLESIHQALSASGYHTRTREEIDAQIKTERDSWGM